MSYHAYVVQVKNLRKHTNADRLMIATFFGNDTIVDLNVHVGDTGVYFPPDGQLSERFCAVNDLVRRKDENGNPCGGYLDPDKRNVKAVKLRGEKSDGLYLPITCLTDFCEISSLRPGNTIDVVNGEEICRKYIPKRNSNAVAGKGTSTRPMKKNIAPTFHEHVETEQLAYNLGKFKPGDIVQLTLKQHGTSQRMGYIPLLVEEKQTFLQRLFHRPPKTHMEYGYITGTRRVILTPQNRNKGWYESDSWREAMADKVRGKLRKGEVVYCEVVGFQGPHGAPIMGSVSNAKVKDKEFSKTYGDTTVFSYGCDPANGYDGAYCDETGTTAYFAPCCDIYVYRMTMVNEDGDEVDYSPAQIKTRCEQMGVKTVMEFETFIIPQDCTDPGEYVVRKVEQYYDGPDPIGRTHIREGVVARILNRDGFVVFKHKNFYFRVLSGIAVDEVTADQAGQMDQDILEEM